MEKDHLDKIFREKLQDFQETPPAGVWDSIQASLDQQKKSRTLLPFWWKLGGVAAVLALLLYLLVPVGGELPLPEEPGLSGVEQNQEQDTEAGEEGSPSESPVLQPESFPAGDSTEGAVADSKDASRPRENENTNAGEAVVKQEQENNKSLHSEEEKSGIAAADGKPQVKESGKDSDRVVEKEDEGLKGLAETGDNRDEVFPKEEVAEESGEKTVLDDAADEEAIAEAPDGKKSILEAVTEEEEIVEGETGKKWSVGPRVAPVYFNAFGEGSPIHSSFASNAKSGNVNMSYGLSVAYDISKKLSLRSGIHRVDYGYDTNDISFSSSVLASTNEEIDNINYNLTARNLVVRSTAEAKDPQGMAASDVAAQDPSRSGRMVQQFGYLEIPMELNYALIDRKFGVDLSGGISSLFLIDNSVNLESNGSATSMGEANNINSVNFSTNIGFGLHYEVLPSLQLHVEPVFKYQLNTFSDTSGNFNPYSLGVYSGVNFRF